MKYIELINSLVLFLGLMLIAREDHESQIISNRKLLILFIYKLLSDLVLLFNLALKGVIDRLFGMKIFSERLGLAIFTIVVLTIISLIFSKSIGMGDVKLIGFLTYYLGISAFFLIVFALLLLFIRHLILKLRSLKMNSLPLGPCVFAAYTFFIAISLI